MQRLRSSCISKAGVPRSGLDIEGIIMFLNSPRPDLKKIAIAVSAAFVIGIAGPSMAGPGRTGLSRILSDSDLTPDDIKLATNAAESLYTKEGVAPGEKVKWSSAKSGAFGVVVVLQVDLSENCVTFRHLIEAGSETRSRLDLRRCRNADGEWVLNAQ